MGIAVGFRRSGSGERGEWKAGGEGL